MTRAGSAESYLPRFRTALCSLFVRSVTILAVTVASATSLVAHPIAGGLGQTLVVRPTMKVWPATLDVRALPADSAVSSMTTAAEAVDETPPTITAEVSPAPNAAGWHTTSVTVTFVCSDPESAITSCTSTQRVSAEVVEKYVSGHARNAAGLSASVTVVVNLDRSVPQLSVYTPRSGDVMPTGTTTVTVRGNVTDLSGIESVICDSVVATVNDQQFTCSVSVTDGSNLLRIEARDRAGQIAVAELTVTVGDGPPSTAIEVSPKTMTMIGGETRTIVVTDDRGRSIVDGTWTVDQPLVAQVEQTDGSITVRALAPGQATLTIVSAALTAQATVTVLAAGSSMPSGTSLWSLTGTTVPPRGGVLRAVRPDSEDSGHDPALFFIDEGTELHPGGLVRRWDRPSRIRATTVDGRQLWDRSFSDRMVIQVAADTQGGLVLVYPAQTDSAGKYRPGTIQRLDGQTGAVSWERVVEGGAGTFSEVAIDANGTVYATEYPYYGTNVYLVGIDAAGGVQRRSLPQGRYHRIDSGEADQTSEGFTVPMASGPIIRDDGAVVLMSTHRNWTNYVVCSWWPDGVRCATDFSREGEYRAFPELIEVRAMGTPQRYPLDVSAYLAANSDFTLDGSTVRLMPDGTGGMLLGHRQHPLVYRADTNFVVTSRNFLPTLGSFSSAYSTEYVLGEDGAYMVVVGYTSGSPTPFWARTFSFDPVGLTDLSTAALGPLRAEPRQLQLRFALAGGGIYISGPSEAYAVNASVSAAGFGGGGNASQALAGLWTGWNVGPAVATGADTAIARSEWPYFRGTPQAGNAPRLWYSTADAAAVGALQFYNPISIIQNREYGGSVCRAETGRYLPTIPNRNDLYSDSINPSTCESMVLPGQNLSPAGRYHTHGRHGNEGLSPGDKLNADQNFPGIPSYVASPCGSIYRYTGPNGYMEVSGVTVIIGERLPQRTETSLTCSNQ